MSAPKFRSLEGEICEVADMADLTANYVGETIDRIMEYKSKHKEVFVPIGPDEARLIKFCVYHLNLMVDNMKDRFYEEIEAK